MGNIFISNKHNKDLAHIALESFPKNHDAMHPVQQVSTFIFLSNSFRLFCGSQDISA
jgi:hypothetical protein